MTGRFFGLPVGILAVMMLAPLFCAFLLQERQALIGFLVAILIASFYAVAVLLALQNRGERFEGRGRGALFLQLAVFWFLLPVFAAIPFAVGGNINVIGAYFEAVSGMTTTGASVVDNPDHLARSLLLWRALLQWLGGLATLIMIAAFLSPLKLVEMGEGAPVLSHGGGGSFATMELQRIALTLLAPYGALTVLCLMALLASGMEGFHALCMSLSLISTGGFVSRETIELTAFAKMIFVLFMLLGAMNFTYHCAAMRGNFRFHRGASELRLLLCFWLVAAALLAFSFFDANAQGWLESLGAGLFASASLLSTTAIPPMDAGGAYFAPLPLLLLLPVLGGCCFSTAGGIKLARILLVTRHSLRELTRLVHPSSVVPVAGDISAAGMRSIWAYFGAFFLCLGIGTAVLSFSGVDFLPSLTAATAALSNAGPMLQYLDPAVLGQDSYGRFPVLGKAVLIFLMVAGRLEILLLLGLFLPSYWRA